MKKNKANGNQKAKVKSRPGSKFVTQDGLDDTMMSMQTVEKEAYFLLGVLFGMKQSGRPMEEIRKLASSIVARGDR